VSRMRKGGDKRLKGAISRFARLPGLMSGRKEKMIEIVSTHHLGPKKSIAVARIAGKLLVLGISNESINLITQIEEGSDLDLDALMDADTFGAPAPAPATPTMYRAPAPKPAPVSKGSGAVAAAAGGLFSDLLSAERVKPSASSAPASAMAGNVRARIRSRLEGLKPL
jgi:hypothetical protein